MKFNIIALVYMGFEATYKPLFLCAPGISDNFMPTNRCAISGLQKIEI